MTDSDDRFEKACLRANKDLDSDKHFFERRPHRRYRIRQSSAAEIEALGLVGERPMWLPPGLRWFSVIRQVVPGERLRLLIAGPRDAETDLSDEHACVLWRYAFERLLNADKIEELIQARERSA